MHDPEPAFPLQTRAPEIKTSTPFYVDTVASGLERPWGLAFLPDGRMIVTEKPGRIRIIDRDGNVGDSILGVPAVHFQQDGGLMDIILTPDFPQSREIIWSYSEKRDTGYVPSVARGILSKDEKNLEQVEVIYRAGPGIGSVMHYGTTLLFDDKGYLFVTFGERFEERIRGRAQSHHSAFGKIIRIDRNGAPAPGNPFTSQEDTLSEIWATGFRDPQGIAFHPETGELWSSDHGPRGGDEINIVNPGSNYGWPLVSYGTEYDKTLVNGGLTDLPGMTQPVYFWNPAVAPAHIEFCSGKMFPEWRNNLFVACLRGTKLIRLELNGHKVSGEEWLLEDWDQRIRGVREGPDGSMYLWTDQGEGCIVRLVKEEEI